MNRESLFLLFRVFCVICGLILLAAFSILDLDGEKVFGAEIGKPRKAIPVLVFRNISDTSGETSRELVLASGMQDVGVTFKQCLIEHLNDKGKFQVFDEADPAIATNPVPDTGIAVTGSKNLKPMLYMDGTITNVSYVIKKNQIMDPETFAAVVLKKEFIVVTAVINLTDPSSSETLYSFQIEGEAQIAKVTTRVNANKPIGQVAIEDERLTDLYKAMCVASYDLYNQLLEAFPIEGSIIEIVKKGRTAIIDLGSDSGVSVDDLFDVIEVKYRVVKGEFVGDEECCGECIVVEILDQQRCLVKKRDGALPIGFLVRLKGIDPNKR